MFTVSNQNNVYSILDDWCICINISSRPSALDNNSSVAPYNVESSYRIRYKLLLSNITSSNMAFRELVRVLSRILRVILHRCGTCNGGKGGAKLCNSPLARLSLTVIITITTTFTVTVTNTITSLLPVASGAQFAFRPPPAG